jgi:hypothetical protein
VGESFFRGDDGGESIGDAIFGEWIAEYGGRPGLAEDLAESFAWQVGLERQVGGARLQAAVEGGDSEGRALHADGDGPVAVGSVAAERVSDLVGELVELLIGPRAVFEANRFALWGAVDLVFKQADQRGGRSVVDLGLVEGLDQLLALVATEQVRLVQGRVGLLDEGLEAAQVAVGQLADGLGGPAGRVVVQSDIEPSVLAIGLPLEVGHEGEVGVLEDGGLIDGEGVELFELVVDMKMVCS